MTGIAARDDWARGIRYFRHFGLAPASDMIHRIAEQNALIRVGH
jgi:hypothetical protein